MKFISFFFYQTKEFHSQNKIITQTKKQFNLDEVETNIKNKQEEIKHLNEQSRDVKYIIKEIKERLSFIERQEINQKLNNIYIGISEDKPLIKKLLK